MKIEGTIPPETLRWIILLVFVAIGGTQHEAILAMGGM